MEVGQPVLTPDGLLTGFQDKLEPFVAQNLLRRILTGEAEWEGWNDKTMKRNNTATRPVTAEDRPEVKQATLTLPPRINISSKTGITVDDERTTTNAAIMEETTKNNDGTLTYKGKKFTSQSALDLFKRTQQSQ